MRLLGVPRAPQTLPEASQRPPKGLPKASQRPPKASRRRPNGSPYGLPKHQKDPCEFLLPLAIFWKACGDLFVTTRTLSVACRSGLMATPSFHRPLWPPASASWCIQVEVPKSFPGGPKIDLRRSKIDLRGPKIVPRTPLGTSWGPLGASLGTPWGPLWVSPRGSTGSPMGPQGSPRGVRGISQGPPMGPQGVPP